MTRPPAIAPELASLAVPIGTVQPFPGNPRRGNVDALRRSLGRWGQVRPILIQKSSGYVVAGNHLHDAALRGPLYADGSSGDPYTHIAAVTLDIDDTEARAYVVADNQLSALGDNDPDALMAWLADLHQRNAIDDALGFNSEELDRFLYGLTGTETDKDDVPTPRTITVQQGELYALGRHRLLCGDATDPAAYARLTAGKVLDLIWTDPPYGVEYVGKTGEALVISNDQANEEAMRELLSASLQLSLDAVRPGGAVYVSSPGGSMSTVFVEALKALEVYRQTIIWVKDVFVMGHSDYHWRHEPLLNGSKPDPKKKPKAKQAQPIHYGWRPGAAHYFVTDRTLDTVWEIDRPKASREHPTMKPVELVERSILSSSRRGDSVLDPFAGSGTTIIAAERTDRTCYAMELEPMYAQVCIERWQQQTGEKAERL